MDRVVLDEIECLNDYVAVMLMPTTKGLVIESETQAKIVTEGLVVGVGPDSKNYIAINDCVVFRQNTYMMLRPLPGYENRTVIMMHRTDLVIKIDNTRSGEFIVRPRGAAH